MQIESRLSSAHMSVFLFAKAYAGRFVLRHATRSMMAQNQNSSVYYFNKDVSEYIELPYLILKDVVFSYDIHKGLITFTSIFRRIITKKIANALKIKSIWNNMLRKGFLIHYESK